jgi:hypothetical protein
MASCDAALIIPATGYTHGFEDDANPSGYSNTTYSGTVAVDATEANRGSKSLSFSVVPHGGAYAYITTTTATQVGADRYVSFRIRFSPDTALNDDGRYHVWSAGTPTSGDYATFALRVLRTVSSGEKGEIWEFYTKVLQDGGETDQEQIWSCLPVRGVWHDVQIALTGWGTDNTVMALWIDGVPAIDHTTGVNTSPPRDTTGLTLSCESFGIHATTSAAGMTDEILIDDIRVSNSPLAFLCHDQYVVAVPVGADVNITTACSIASTATLEYGTATGDYGEPVSSTATQSDTQHAWTIENVAGASTYYYQITYTATGDANDIQITPEYQFSTDPGASADTTVLATSDRHVGYYDATGCPSKLQSTVSPATIDLYIDLGDATFMSSAASAAAARNGFISSMATIKPYTTQMLYAPVGGNHDIYAADAAAAWLAYTGVPANYSFDFGRVHYAAMVTIGGAFGSTATDWVTTDLAGADREYNVVLSHCGSVVWPGTLSTLADYDTLHAILVSDVTALHICGHRHLNNRFVTGGVMVLSIPTLANGYSGIDPLTNDGEATRYPEWGTMKGGSGDARGYCVLEANDHHIAVSTYHVADGLTAPALSDLFRWHPGMLGTRTTVSQ